MNDTSSTLVAHCGARKVTREELKEIPVPEGTDTHQPLSHFGIVEVLEEALSFRYLKVIKDEYAVSADGMKMFGVMDLNTGFDGGSFSIGLRNSNDKSMRLALTAGYRVFVCDNMAFSGDFTPLLHKHTRNLDLRDSISVAVDRIQRGFASLETRVNDMSGYGLTDNDARIFIYTVFLERAVKGVPRNMMPLVHDHYFNPAHDEFKPRNLWSLSNAFTSAFKNLAPTKQFEVTARLGAFLNGVQNDMKHKPEGMQLAHLDKVIGDADRSGARLALSETRDEKDSSIDGSPSNESTFENEPGTNQKTTMPDVEFPNGGDREGETYENYEEYLDEFADTGDFNRQFRGGVR